MSRRQHRVPLVKRFVYSGLVQVPALGGGLVALVAPWVNCCCVVDLIVRAEKNPCTLKLDCARPMKTAQVMMTYRSWWPLGLPCAPKPPNSGGHWGAFCWLWSVTFSKYGIP